MATPLITHRKVSSGRINPKVEVDLSNWNDTHVVTGLENVPNVDTSNAANIVFTATGGIGRFLSSRLSDFYSVIDYGADPAGTIDSAPAFRLALAAVPYGGELFMPPGRYRMASWVNGSILDFSNFPNKGITLRGVGWQLKVLGSFASISGTVLFIDHTVPNTVDFYGITPTDQVTGMGFKDFTVVPEGGAFTQPFGRHGINIDTTNGTTGYVDGLLMENVFIDNFANGLSLYVHGLAGGNTLIGATISRRCKLMTTKFDNVADNNTIRECTFGANALTSVSGATVAAGGSGGTNGAQTVTVVGGTGTAATLNVTVSGGAITAINSVTTPGFYTVFPANPVAVTGASLTGATLNLQTNNPNLGIYINQVSGATNFLLDACNFVNQDGAIQIAAAKTPIIRACEFEQNAGVNTLNKMIDINGSVATVEGPIVENCSFSNNSTNAVIPISFGAVSGGKINGNTIRVPTGGTHINLGGSTQQVTVDANTYFVNGVVQGAGTISDSGSRDVIRDAGWTAYTPTLTADAGTFGSLGTVTGRFRLIDRKTLMVELDITITTIGTASGAFHASLPSGFVAARDCCLTGREFAVNGKMLNSSIIAGGTLNSITYYDNTAIVTNGVQLVFSGTIEIQ